MKMSQEKRGAHTIVKIAGTLAMSDSTRLLQEHFETVAAEGAGAVMLDLSGLEHLDSTAVGVLVGAGPGTGRRRVRTAAACARCSLQPVAWRAASRCATLVGRIGSTEWMRNGSMIGSQRASMVGRC